MASAEARFDEGLEEQLHRYKLELRGQFRRSCLTYSVAMLTLFFVVDALPYVSCIAAVWSLLLGLEAHSVFIASKKVDSDRFHRWQSRQQWISAGSGDLRSLKGLQNKPSGLPR